MPGRGKGNNYLALLNEAKRLKLAQGQGERHIAGEIQLDSHESESESGNLNFEEVLRKATPADIWSEYDWFLRNLPNLLDSAEEELVNKVRENLNIKHIRHLLSQGDERVSKDKREFAILDALSCKLGLSLKIILAPPTQHCLLCKGKLQRNNQPTQAVLHTLNGPEMATKIAYECKRCSDIYTFRGKFESNNRLYYQVDHFGNPSDTAV